jgi:hypothetical protein
MLNLVVITTLLLFFSFGLSIVSIVSNEWFFISIKSECKRWDCIHSEYFENALRYGLWYACPFNGRTDQAGGGYGSFAWASVDESKKQCFFFSYFNADNGKVQRNNMYSRLLKDSHLVDLEPYQIAQIRVLFLVGTVCLFVATVWSSVLLVYFCRVPDLQMKAASMLHAIALFMFLFVDLTTRIVAFVLFSVNSGNYLDYLFRTSYTLDTNKNHFTAEYNEFFDELLGNYRVTSQWLVK